MDNCCINVNVSENTEMCISDVCLNILVSFVSDDKYFVSGISPPLLNIRHFAGHEM